MSEIEIGQIRLPEWSNRATGWYRFPVRVRAYSRSENPDSILNNISNHNSKTHTGRKLNNTVEKKLGHVPGYVSRERGATIYPPNKNFVLEISIRREMNMEINN